MIEVERERSIAGTTSRSPRPRSSSEWRAQETDFRSDYESNYAAEGAKSLRTAESAGAQPCPRRLPPISRYSESLVPDTKPGPDSHKAVGIYDRPASADRTRRAIWMIAIVAVLAFIAYLLLR